MPVTWRFSASTQIMSQHLKYFFNFDKSRTITFESWKFFHPDIHSFSYDFCSVGTFVHLLIYHPGHSFPHTVVIPPPSGGTHILQTISSLFTEPVSNQTLSITGNLIYSTCKCWLAMKEEFSQSFLAFIEM